MNVIEIIDKTKRTIFLSEERYKHIVKHEEMQNKLEWVKETLENPIKIATYFPEENVKYYYRYYKEITLKAKYLRVIVKYLNGKGFIITAYFVEHLK